MNLALAGTLSVLVISVIVFFSGRVRSDVVALTATATLASLGVLTSNEAFSGFSSNAVIILISVFIINEALQRTGVSKQLGGFLALSGIKSEGKLVGLVMAAGAGFSLFLNNIVATAVLMPGVTGAAKKASIPPSKVLMPLSFGVMLGGTATLLTTMNIIVSNVLEESGIPGYGLLDFFPTGLPLVAAGILYMVYIGRHKLPMGQAREELMSESGRKKDLLDLYKLGENCFKAKIPADSYLVGKTVAESTFREKFDLDVVAVEKSDGLPCVLHPETVFEKGDTLILKGNEEEFKKKDREPLLEILPCTCLEERNIGSASTVLAEVMLAPRSSLLGRTLKEIEFRRRYGMAVLAVWRGDKPMTDITIQKEKLMFGDALLLQGHRDRLKYIEKDPDLILLSAETTPPPLKLKGSLTLLILAATLGAIIFTPLPMAQMLFTGAVAMILVKSVTMEQAYRSIDWSSVFFVAGMLPMALAMTKSGAAGLLSRSIVLGFGSSYPILIVGVLFLVSALLTQAVSGPVVAALMAPIAVSVSAVSGFPPHALAMAVVLGSSMAFITPLGHSVNILVMGSGGYSFGDFRKVGLPLFCILALVAVLGITIRWSLF